MKAKKAKISIIALITAIALFTSCGLNEEQVKPMAESTPIGTAAAPVQTFEPGKGKAQITEVMSKNKATIMADDGSFPDWVEIQNLTDKELDIDNWQISDSSEGNGMLLRGSIAPGEYAAFFTSGFGLSEGESAYLFDANGNLVDSFEITNDTSDWSNTRAGQSKYPTPGRENTKEAFAQLQSEKTVEGPIVINEVAVENFSYYYTTDEAECTDYVEIKNISSVPVNIGSYYISDDLDDLKQYKLPDNELAPGELMVILCDKSLASGTGGYYVAPFSLNSENERLYISDESGSIIDFTSLKDIPYMGSYGRMSGENGYFYFDRQTPGEENYNGRRYIAETPVSLTRDGAYDSVDCVTVELEGEGEIYYTLDGTVPTEASIKYDGPITLTETTIVRAVSVLKNAYNSRALTLSFFINEYHTLPIASVVSDKKAEFNNNFVNGYKLTETPGVLSYYDENGSFTIGAGIKLHGDTSLLLAKKNLSFRFRGCYGSEKLVYDIFGGGITTFTNLLLRAGQEQRDTIVRGEACTNLLSQYSDSVIYQRSRYCVVYVDGVYNGIYSIKDKINEQMYADLKGVGKGSVTINEASLYVNDPFYYEVLTPILNSDMSDDEAFAKATQYLDLQSVADWIILEAWTGNYDLQLGNLKYVKSTELDGKWQLCLYDLDCAFADIGYVYDFLQNMSVTIGVIQRKLLQNDSYRQMFLERASQVYGNVLTDENIIAQIDMLAGEVRPEVERDAAVSGLGLDLFDKHIETLENRIESQHWTETAITKLCGYLNLTKDERAYYFGIDG